MQHTNKANKEKQRNVEPKIFAPIIEAMVNHSNSMDLVKIGMLAYQFMKSYYEDITLLGLSKWHFVCTTLSFNIEMYLW